MCEYCESKFELKQVSAIVCYLSDAVGLIEGWNCTDLYSRYIVD